jgi:hypothetical protein
MSVGDLLIRIVAKLDAAGIPHMVAGSFASTYYGVPRATHDVDIVIDPTRASLERFIHDLPPADYSADMDAALDALRRRSQFNVLDMETGWKVDFIVRKQRPFSLEEFSRRQPAELSGARVQVASAEDSIVAKLEWAKLGDSERQLRDVAGMLETRGAAIDLAYVERWVGQLGLQSQWQRARELAA